MFVVTREGVGRHEIVGVFTTLKKAESAAIEAVQAEPDNYHRFCVIQLTINEVYKSSVGTYHGGWDERVITEVSKIQDSINVDRRLNPDEITECPLIGLAYDILSGDPMALDAAKDILKV